MDELTRLLMLIAQGYNRIATIYPIPKYMTGQQERNTAHIAEKTQLDTRLCTSYRTNWQNFPTQSPVCSGDDGFPGRLDGITFSKWRNNSIKGYGNAIVPQVAYQIFEQYRDWETDRKSTRLNSSHSAKSRMPSSA